MRKIVFLSLWMVVFSFASATAQQNGERQGRGQRGPSPEYLAMIDSLDLDADQKVQFDAMETMFRDKSRKEMKTARENGAEREAMREIRNKLQTEQLAVLQNLFTNDQYKIYSEFMAKQQKRRGGRKGRGQG